MIVEYIFNSSYKYILKERNFNTIRDVDMPGRPLIHNDIALDPQTLEGVQATVRRLARGFSTPSTPSCTGNDSATESGSSARSALNDAQAVKQKGTQINVRIDSPPKTQTNPPRGQARPFSNELPSTITGLRTWLRQGRLSPAEALSLQNLRLTSGDAHIRSVAKFCTWSAPETVVAPLAGIGLAHKDNIANGQFAPGNGLPDNQRAGMVRPTAPILARLNIQGATQLAALAMAERACGATSENHHFPAVVNPLDDTLFVGGSSSGSAAAVAAGFCYGSLGTDTAGSVRIPAASCGLLGFKPSRGVLSGEGVTPLAPSLDTVGLLTRTASDLLALFQAAGPRITGPLPEAGSLRVANGLNFQRMAPSVADVLERFVARLSGMLKLHPQPFLLPKEVSLFGETLFYYEAGRLHRAALQADPASMNVVARQICAQGLMLPTDWHARAQHDRGPLCDAFIQHHFSDADLLLIPAFTTSVPEHQHVTFGSSKFDPAALLEVFRWMMPANFLDLPALVMPVGTDTQGRPVSIQILGRPGSELALLALATQFEVESSDTRGLFSLGAPHMQP